MEPWKIPCLGLVKSLHNISESSDLMNLVTIHENSLEFFSGGLFLWKKLVEHLHCIVFQFRWLNCSYTWRGIAWWPCIYSSFFWNCEGEALRRVVLHTITSLAEIVGEWLLTERYLTFYKTLEMRDEQIVSEHGSLIIWTSIVVLWICLILCKEVCHTHRQVFTM